MNDKPYFRFYPNANEEGGPFKHSDERCDVCRREAVWLYTGEIYMEGELPGVCARCMNSGALRECLPTDGYTLQDIILESVDDNLANELLLATPGVASINSFDWPVIDGEPLAYICVGDEAVLKRNAAAQQAIAEAFAQLGDENGDPSHALVFKRLDADEYVAVIDLD